MRTTIRVRLVPCAPRAIDTPTAPTDPNATDLRTEDGHRRLPVTLR